MNKEEMFKLNVIDKVKEIEKRNFIKIKRLEALNNIITFKFENKKTVKEEALNVIQKGALMGAITLNDSYDNYKKEAVENGYEEDEHVKMMLEMKRNLNL